jgi:hypothetical protein
MGADQKRPLGLGGAVAVDLGPLGFQLGEAGFELFVFSGELVFAILRRFELLQKLFAILLLLLSDGRGDGRGDGDEEHGEDAEAVETVRGTGQPHHHVGRHDCRQV